MAIEDLEQLFALRSIPRSRGGRRRTGWGQTYRAAPGNSCLYGIVADGHEFVKIGKADDPYRRMMDHQVSSPFQLNMLSFVESDTASVLRMERCAHSIMRSAGYIGCGEWWDVPQNLVPEVFRHVAQRTGAVLAKAVGSSEIDERVDRYERQKWTRRLRRAPISRC